MLQGVIDNLQIDNADMDYLTNLPNRRGLYHFYSSLNERESVHAMYVDVDNFKRINDIYGHSMGDKLLVCVSNLIRENTNGFASRIGGDEFVILLDGRLEDGAVMGMAEAMRDGLPESGFRKDILSLISLSIGIVLRQHAAQSLDEILARCDAAMYQSKYNGKNQYTVYDSEDKAFEISRHIELEMEDALESGQFRVYLQPKVNMITSEIVSAEALSRWVHPIDGMRTPELYIPIFEKNGFIAKLDMFMFEEVCRLKASWKDRIYGNMPVSVNMSRLHLYNKNFPEQLAAICDKYAVPYSEMELEITESVFIKDTNELTQMTQRLHDKGFLVSIDDFGSGFSALNLLKDLTVDTVKLDKAFLRSSSNNARGRHVIRNVIAMCRDLKIQVVTEGIESRDQIDFITRCSCQVAQGFYYSKPLPVGDFEDYAQIHKRDILTAYRFPLDGSEIVSEDGSIHGEYTGGEIQVRDGIFAGQKAMYFPGGEQEENVVEMDPAAISNDSYTVSFWVYPEKHHFWSSTLYVKFETGFASFCPMAWEGSADFRIRDSREVNGWYDTPVCGLQEETWYHIVVGYNAQTEISMVFVNGDPVAMMKEVPPNRFVKRIMIGGDVFQPSFVGRICELVIYNECKDYDFIKELHNSYIEREDYIAGALKHIV